MASAIVQLAFVALYVVSTPVLAYLVWDAKQATEESTARLEGTRISTGEVVSEPARADRTVADD
jgi:hypothetical protein